MKVTQVEITCKVCGKTDYVFNFRAHEGTCTSCGSDALMERLRNDPVATARIARAVKGLGGTR